MREILATVNLKALLKVSVFPIFVMLYILYPLWILADGPLLVAVFGYAIVAMPFVIRLLIDSILPENSIEIDVGKFIGSRKLDVLYFLGTAIVYWLFLYPLIFAPLLPRGDEPAHVARIVQLSELFTAGGVINSLLVGVGLLLGFTIIVIILLVWSSSKRESFFLWPLLRLIFKTRVRYLVYAVIAALPLLLGFASLYLNLGTYSLTRYGPFHPVVFVLPFLFLDYSSSVIIVWKTLNLLIMVGAAVIIRRLTAEILEKVDESLGLETIQNRILSMLAGWLFLLFPPTIQFATEIYLTSGVALFFAVNCLLLVRTLTVQDGNQQRFYLVLLALFLGFSTLWKRVLLVQAAAVFVILLLFLVLRTPSDRKTAVFTWLKSGVIYVCIFGPWFIIVQLQGYIWREYVPDFSLLLPPNVFDYLLRFDSQAGLILGVTGYVSLAIILVAGIALRNRTLTILAPQFALWYLFFNLDAGWPHTVDRFFVPVLSLFTISIVVSIGILMVYSTEYISHFSAKFGLKEISTVEHPTIWSRKSLLTFILLMVVFGTTLVGTTQNGVTGYVYVNSSLENNYLPYDQAAQYIDQQIVGNLSLLYSVWGPSSLNYYLNIYGDYPFVGDYIGEKWVPDSNNITAIAFIDFLESSGYEVVVLPSIHLVDSRLIPTDVVETLVNDYNSLGIAHLEIFHYGANEIFIWLL